MADNIDITPGTGKTVATDDCGADGHTQVVKLAYSADGTATKIGADANGLDVDVVRLPSGTVAGSSSLPAGTNNIGDVDVLSLPALPAGTNNIGDVDVLSVPADPFGANADAASATGSISAKLRFIAGTGIPVTSLPALAAGSATIGKLAANSGVDIGDVDVTSLPALPAGSNNIGDVDVLTLPAPLGAAGAASIAKAEDAASANADVGVPAMAVRKATPANTSGTDGDYEMLQISAGRLWTSAAIDTALPAGTNAIGKLAANSGVDIGDVDVTSLTGGTIAHDSVDSGNPIKVGARAAALAASVTLVAAADRTDNVADLDGALITRPYCQLGDIISDVKTVTDGSSTAFTGSFANTANVRNYITALSMWNTSGTAVTVDLRDGTGGSVIWTGIVPAGGGNNIAFNPPLRQPTVNTALAMDPSAAASTVGCSVTGFKSKA